MAKPIKGTNSDDTVLTTGTPGNDHIQGRDGNDIITGGKGNDDIDGGKGIDTAVYSGNFAQYSISFQNHGNDNVTVADTVAGRGGTDSLHHVEFLKFADALFSTEHNTVDHFGTVDAEAIDPGPGPNTGF